MSDYMQFLQDFWSFFWFPLQSLLDDPNMITYFVFLVVVSLVVVVFLRKVFAWFNFI